MKPFKWCIIIVVDLCKVILRHNDNIDVRVIGHELLGKNFVCAAVLV